MPRGTRAKGLDALPDEIVDFVSIMIHAAVYSLAAVDEPRRLFWFTVSGVVLGMCLMTDYKQLRSVETSIQYYRFVSRSLLPFTMAWWYAMESNAQTLQTDQWVVWLGEYAFQVTGIAVLISRYVVGGPMYGIPESTVTSLYREAWTLKNVAQGYRAFQTGKVLGVVAAGAETVVACGLVVKWFMGGYPRRRSVGLGTLIYSLAKLIPML